MDRFLKSTKLGKIFPGNHPKTRARDVWHLTNQVTRKLLAHTMGVWLNLRQGREPLDLDGLLVA
jgi:hypothetical protein